MGDEELELVRGRLALLGRPHRPDDVAQVMSELGLVVSDALVLWTLERLRTTSVGAGLLEPLLKLPGVTDVLVNGPDRVYIDRGQGLELTQVRFGSDAEVRALATRMAASVGRRLDDASPWVDARLADGTRVHAVLGVLSATGTCLSLRVPSRQGLTLADWVANGSMTIGCRHLLEQLVASRRAFLVSGGTGTGKTTLLGSLLALVDPEQRVLVVEDSRELKVDHPHVVSLEGRVANAEGAGAVTLTDLVRQALRMRPDRLVLGEARGAELSDLLMAFNTGHEGGCGTVHANSAADVPARLEALAALGGMGRAACHAQVVAAIQVVVHVTRGDDRRRRVSEIGVVEAVSDQLRVVPAVRWRQDATEVRGAGWQRLLEVVDEAQLVGSVPVLQGS
ncbi:TadA family conjugal transfer-associated ATPase [Aestuariimicrobium ganziense]|uniref:TadA family conjugal transfer-associated ATPase n=1 Tax=Aestuariimicrobium ganziense TaxID=2773677 RepID=UPI001941DE75|nr:TadA family conjugal transfer-associated ATPase [Aestuariimicrobium ganziense]